MDIWATKDLNQREDDEAARLVRPSPKVKPPRRDRRREEMNPDRDPDVDADPDLKGDPDLSLNFKTIGGSVDPLVYRVAGRWLKADIDRSKLITVRLRENPSKTVQVTEDTLKKEPSKYEIVEEKDEGPKEGQGAEGKPAPEKAEAAPSEPKKEEPSSDAAKARQSLDDLAKNDPEIASVLKDFGDPQAHLFGLAKANPDLPADRFMRGRKLPEGIKTVGQLQQAMALKPSKKPKSVKEAPKEPDAPKTEKAPEPEQAKAEEPSKAQQEVVKDVQDQVSKAVAEKPPTSPEEMKALVSQITKAIQEGFSSLQKEKGKPAKEEQPQKEETGPKEEKPSKSESKKKPEKKPEYAGPPPPKRPEPSEEESLNADEAIMDTFPPEIAEHLLSQNLHPQDVSQLVSSYRMATEHDVDPSNISAFAAKLADRYQPDPKLVEPPQKVEKNGKKVPFESLTPEEQAEEMQNHRMQTMAMSLAAKNQLVKSLNMKSGAPRDLSEKLADFLLTKGDPEKRMERATQEAKNLFTEQLQSGETKKPVPDKDIRKILTNLSKDPATQKIAVGYFQGQDYQAARNRFLNHESNDNISEHYHPGEIANGITKASEFLEERSRLYPDGSEAVNTGGLFRTRVMSKLKTLAPEKYPFVRDRMISYEGNQFKHAYRKFEKDQEKFNRAVVKAQQAVEKEMSKEKDKVESGDPYRIPADSLQERVQERLQKEGVHAPKEPVEPPWYKWWEARQEGRNAGKDLWDKFMRPSKKSSSVYSSYPGIWTMGVSSNRPVTAGQDRQAVYWGVAPYPPGKEGFAPYQEWSQAHARDLGESDYGRLLSAAREWLRVPVIGRKIEGMVRDTQLRAALDLAIRDLDGGKYSVGLHPTVYNQLLAKLAGDAGPYELLTGVPAEIPYAGVKTAEQSKSTYAPTPGEVPPMKLSNELLTIASRVASTNPEAAYELVNLARKLTAGEVPPQFLEHMKGKKDEGDKKDEEKKDQGQGQQKEASKDALKNLRSLVIHTAAKHPEAREAFLPLLQAIKNV